MRLIRFMVTFLLIAALGIALITTRPTKREFAAWYVEHNQTGMGGFFDDAYAKLVEQRTTMKEYVVFSVFEVEDDGNYVGLLGHFFGRGAVEGVVEGSVEKAEELLQDLQDNKDNKK